MSLASLALNTSYVLMLLALVLKDILWLRATMSAAQVFFVLFGVATRTPPIIGWNLLFLGINLRQIQKILEERRPVDLPSDLDRIHRSTFFYLTAAGFGKLWRLGETIRPTGTLLAPGQVPIALLYILEGVVEIRNEHTLIATLEPGQFVGEMEFVTSEPVQVTARCGGPVALRRWSRADMIRIEAEDPHLCIHIQGVLGRDIMKKLQSTNPERGPADVGTPGRSPRENHHPLATPGSADPLAAEEPSP